MVRLADRGLHRGRRMSGEVLHCNDCVDEFRADFQDI